MYDAVYDSSLNIATLEMELYPVIISHSHHDNIDLIFENIALEIIT